MSFMLSDEQEQLLASVKRYANDMCEAGARRGAFESESGFDQDFWSGLMDLGAGGICIPVEHGGLGLEMLDLALVAEALGYAGAPGPFLGHALAGIAIASFGSREQRDRWLPGLAGGAIRGAVALTDRAGSGTERWSGSLQDRRITADRPMSVYPDGAALIVVGAPGGGLAIVEPGAAGVAIDRMKGVDRTRRLSQLVLADAPYEELPGGGGQRLLDAACVLLAADAFGGAEQLVERSRDYLLTREQFGRPIGAFQALKHQLAEMAVAVEPLRAFYWYAAHTYDHEPDDASRIAALAKAHAAEVFMRVARDSVEAHGGIGYTWECEVQIWLKRAMFDYAFLGGPDVHRARAAALAGWTT